MDSIATPVAEGAKELFEDSPIAERRRAYWVAGAFFGVFLGAAALIPLDSGAVANGKVVVSGNRQAVQHREGGVISGLYVKEGQYVKKGQLLLAIAASEIAATERGLAAERLSLLAQRQRLMVERDGLAKMSPPPEFAALSDEDRQLAQDAFEGQRRLFVARNNSSGAQHGVLSQRSRQTEQQINGFRQQMVSNREQRRLITDEIVGMKQLEAKGFASTNRIRALERAAAQLDGEYGALSAQIATSRESIGEVAMQGLSIDNSRLQDVSEQMRDVSLRLDEIGPKLAAAKEQLARAQVRAPSSGRVVGLKVFTVGGVVSPGEMLMEIVPQDRELVIEALVSPKDADDLYPGLAAEVRLPAIQERNVPILQGRIDTVSADSFTDERTGQQFFRAQVRVLEAELDRVKAVRPGRAVIQAGVPAEILFPLRKRTALRYLLEPLTQSLWLAGREE